MAACASCTRTVRSRYNIGGAPACFRCAIEDKALIRRSLIIAVIVGTILVAINQGNRVVGGDVAADLYWKIPLTYVVPYLVATLGALLNARE